MHKHIGFCQYDRFFIPFPSDVTKVWCMPRAEIVGPLIHQRLQHESSDPAGRICQYCLRRQVFDSAHFHYRLNDIARCEILAPVLDRKTLFEESFKNSGLKFWVYPAQRAEILEPSENLME